EAAFARVRSSLDGLRVRDVMTPDPVVVAPDGSVADFIDDYAYARGHSTFPVVDGFGRLAGLVSLREAGAVPREQRAAKRVGDVMAAGDKVSVVGPDDAVLDIVPQLQRPSGRAVVVDRGRIVGIVSTSDIGRALELDQLRGRPREPGAAARPR